jgi:hypothetical protein
MMINNHITLWVDILSPIEPCFACNIVLRFMDLDECAINQPNVILKLKYGAIEHKFFL